MPLITTYATLQAAIADFLNRDDMTAVIPTLIQLGEAKLKRDPRVRQKVVNAAFVVDAATETVPTDCVEVIALEHTGSTYYGPLKVVSDDQIGQVRGETGGVTGPPAYYARAGTTLRFAPIPDKAYTLTITYWGGVTSLSNSATTNWLLTLAPDLYLYASLAEAAPYLKDDARVPMWASELEARIEALYQHEQKASISGTLRRRFNAIG